MLSQEDLKRNFYSKFEPVTETGCWLWLGALNRAYGSFWNGSKPVGAHRFSYEFHCGKTDGLDVLHRCDVPLCVNPRHLFLGTQTDNNADMCKKGRNRSKAPTHCIHGHEFSIANTRHVKNGRQCLTCARARRVSYVAKAKANGMTYGYSCDSKPRYRRK